jgi:hypothetical protein
MSSRKIAPVTAGFEALKLTSEHNAEYWRARDLQRVAERVRQGGRFEAGKRLFSTVYQPLVDQWVLYDNAGDEPALLDWSGKS